MSKARNTQSVLVHLQEASVKLEKPRVATEVAQTHIFKNGIAQLLEEAVIDNAAAEVMAKIWEKSRTFPEKWRDYLSDPEIDALHTRELAIERYVDARLIELIKTHPAYPWFCKILGIGPENIGKMTYKIDIMKCHTASAMNRFLGFGVVKYCSNCDRFIYPKASEEEDDRKIMPVVCPKCRSPLVDRAERRIRGERLHFSIESHSMAWRIGKGLIRAGVRQQCHKCGRTIGKGTLDDAGGKCPDCGGTEFSSAGISKFGQKYLTYKSYLVDRFTQEGKKILPTPAANWMCTNCSTIGKKKADLKECCANPYPVTLQKEEPEGIVWAGHLDTMAMRRMIKLFNVCLWIVWRQTLGLPVREPYAIEVLGHEHKVDPWEMIDRP